MRMGGCGRCKRLGHQADVAELEVLALVREALLRPRLHEDVERLQEPIAALGVGDVEALVVRGQPAAAHAEIDAAAAEVIDGGDVLGDVQRMAEREHLHRDPELHALRAPGQGGGDGERRRQHRAVLLKVDLGQPDGVVAERLGGGHLGHRLLEGDRLAHPRGLAELGEDPELRAARGWRRRVHRGPHTTHSARYNRGRPMRIVFWNICAGGGLRAQRIAATLAAWAPDVVALCEFRGTPPSLALSTALAEYGLAAPVHDRDRRRERTAAGLALAAPPRARTGRAGRARPLAPRRDRRPDAVHDGRHARPQPRDRPQGRVPRRGAVDDPPLAPWTGGAARRHQLGAARDRRGGAGVRPARGRVARRHRAARLGRRVPLAARPRARLHLVLAQRPQRLPARPGVRQPRAAAEGQGHRLRLGRAAPDRRRAGAERSRGPGRSISPTSDILGSPIREEASRCATSSSPPTATSISAGCRPISSRPTPRPSMRDRMPYVTDGPAGAACGRRRAAPTSGVDERHGLGRAPVRARQDPSRRPHGGDRALRGRQARHPPPDRSRPARQGPGPRRRAGRGALRRARRQQPAERSRGGRRGHAHLQRVARRASARSSRSASPGSRRSPTTRSTPPSPRSSAWPSAACCAASTSPTRRT